jgi:hypothetical protein
MTIQAVDGFDLYNGVVANTGLAAKWPGGNPGNLSMVAGRFGGQAVQCAASGTFVRDIQRSFTGIAAVGVGVAVRFATFPSVDTGSSNLIAFLKGATWTFGLRVTSTGAIEANRMTSATGTTVLGTSAVGVILNNTWQYVELQLTISDTTGSVVVKVDGTTVLNLSAQDTNNAVATVDTIHLGISINTGGLGAVQYDDFYLNDTNATLGERKVETLYPTSDVAQGFARSTGAANFSLVNEAQVNGDTNYVQGSNVGDVDTYGIGDLSNSPTTIDAVQVSAFAEKTDATARSIALQVKSGATTSDGANFALAASYAKLERLLLTDPNTSAAWAAAGVNALQGGPKVTV